MSETQDESMGPKTELDDFAVDSIKIGRSLGSANHSKHIGPDEFHERAAFTVRSGTAPVAKAGRSGSILLGLFQMRQCRFRVGRPGVGMAFFALVNCLFEMFDPFGGMSIGLLLLGGLRMG